MQIWPQASKNIKESAAPTWFYPDVDIPYTKAAIAESAKFDPDYVQKVIDIVNHVQILRDIRENQLYYQRLTFAPNLTEENRIRAIKVETINSENLSKRARIIVNKIAAFLPPVP